MPALPISAVNATTDQLTIAAHGLSTGDGPLAVYTAAGTIPGGLAAVTDYYAIRIDASTLKLASSSTNALAGTAVDITSTGSGTLQLLQSLPYRVPFIAAPGAQIKSAADNAAWNSLVALWNLLSGQAQAVFAGITLAAGQHVTVAGSGQFKHGTYTRTVSPAAGAYLGPTPLYVGSGGIAYGSSGFRAGGLSWEATAVGNLVMPVTLEVGERLLAIRAVVQDSPGGTKVTLNALYTNGIALASAGSIVQSSGAGTVQTLTLPSSGTFTQVMTSGSNYMVIISSNAGGSGVSIDSFEYDYDRP